MRATAEGADCSTLQRTSGVSVQQYRGDACLHLVTQYSRAFNAPGSHFHFSSKDPNQRNRLPLRYGRHSTLPVPCLLEFTSSTGRIARFIRAALYSCMSQAATRTTTTEYHDNT